MGRRFGPGLRTDRQARSGVDLVVGTRSLAVVAGIAALSRATDRASRAPRSSRRCFCRPVTCSAASPANSTLFVPCAVPRASRATPANPRCLRSTCSAPAAPPDRVARQVREHVHLTWSNHETLWLTFKDANGNIIRSLHNGSGDISLQLAAGSGRYVVTVGEIVLPINRHWMMCAIMNRFRRINAAARHRPVFDFRMPFLL